MNEELEEALNQIMEKSPRDAGRLGSLADFVCRELERYGLPGVQGGSSRELRVAGIAREKAWDVAYDFAGKRRLLVSLKSIWKNAGGTVPNRIDDLMGEAANVQQLSPEIVVGYILLFDVAADSKRQEDGLYWSEYFEQAVKRIAIRKAPLWNQGLLEGTWFIRFDSRRPAGMRLIEPLKVESEREQFIRALLAELHLREPAIPFTRPLS
jgi:hypothetical protein